ncbi:conserved hypothetical protein [Treponema phagedenis]|uniref:Uncharacterized protein n=1 Tax=Treponema phagedenis TaxID=162 RepID=A0A0B7GSJ8_TREPH|nr:conserved hypothetical protein [Treponema phagedenis]
MPTSLKASILQNSVDAFKHRSEFCELPVDIPVSIMGANYRTVR